MAVVRWRLWNGQADRAIDLIGRLFHDLKADEQGSSAIIALRGGLMNLRTCIEQNRGSIANHGARYCEGKRIASTAAEASVNKLVARRMVKSSRCAGRNMGRSCSFTFAWPLPMAVLRNVSPASRPSNQGRPSLRHSSLYRSFSVPHDRR